MPMPSRWCVYKDARSPAMRAARVGRSRMMTCSDGLCAPPPTAPRPSSVGTPRAAVKFPSDPPDGHLAQGRFNSPIKHRARRRSWPTRRGAPERRTVHSAQHLQLRAGQYRPQAAKLSVKTRGVRYARVANVHMGACMRRNDVRNCPARNYGGLHSDSRCAWLQFIFISRAICNASS